MSLFSSEREPAEGLRIVLGYVFASGVVCTEGKLSGTVTLLCQFAQTVQSRWYTQPDLRDGLRCCLAAVRNNAGLRVPSPDDPHDGEHKRDSRAAQNEISGLRYLWEGQIRRGFNWELVINAGRRHRRRCCHDFFRPR